MLAKSYLINFKLPQEKDIDSVITALKKIGAMDMDITERRSIDDIDDDEEVSMNEAMDIIFSGMSHDEIAGGLLKTARLEKKLTQTELAKLAGSQKTAISEMENGKRTITKDMAEKFAKVLDVNYRVFLCADPSYTPEK